MIFLIVFLFLIQFISLSSSFLFTSGFAITGYVVCEKIPVAYDVQIIPDDDVNVPSVAASRYFMSGQKMEVRANITWFTGSPRAYALIGGQCWLPGERGRIPCAQQVKVPLMRMEELATEREKKHISPVDDPQDLGTIDLINACSNL